MRSFKRGAASFGCFVLGLYAALSIPNDNVFKFAVSFVVFWAVWVGVFKFLESVFDLDE